MKPTRSFILAVLLLGATHAAAQPDAPAELTWYYEEAGAPAQYKVPPGYSVCKDGHTAAARVDDKTFTVAAAGTGGRNLSVAAADTCAEGTSGQRVRLVVLPAFSTAAGSAPTDTFIEPDSMGQQKFLLVLKGMSIKDPEAQKAWALRPLNFSAGKGAWTTATDGSVAYLLEGAVEALPTELQVSLTPAGAPPGVKVLDATKGQSLAPTQFSFSKWRLVDSELNPVISAPNKPEAPVSVSLMLVRRQLQLLAQTATAAVKTAVPCNAAEFTCLYPQAGGVAPISLTLTPTQLSKPVRLLFSLPNDRVYVGETPQTHLLVVVQQDECSYEVTPLTPLLAGFRDTKLYLQIVGYKSGSLDYWSCLDAKQWRQWSVHVEGLQVSTGQHLKPSSFKTDEGQSLAESWSPTVVVELPISKVVADAGGKATLRLAYADGTNVNLRQGTFPMQLAVNTPPAFAGPVRVEVREPHGKQGSSRWQAWEDIGAAGFKDLAVNRNNLLFFEAENLNVWRLRPVSLHINPCDGEVWQRKDRGHQNEGLQGNDGVFCVVPQRETDDGFSFQAVYKPLVKDVLPGLKDPRSETLELGYLEHKTNLRSKPLRSALDIQERASVRCENSRTETAERSVTSLAPEYQSNAVIASAYSGPRAVPAEDLDHCKVVISLRRNGIGEASDDKGPLELKTEALELLQSVGEQSLTITADILPKEQGKEKTNLFTKSVTLRNRDDLEVVNGTVEVPILLQKGGSIQLEDYSVVRVTVAHASEAGYVVGDGSFPKSRMEADLRRMPSYFAGRIVRGVGPRAFLTIEIPTGLVRWPGAGYDATSSTSYRRLEAAVFGIGALAVLEVYDFDNAKQFLSFNPQLHAGVLLSTVPQAGIKPPQLSLVTGMAVRFPSSIKLPSSIESGLASVFWVEWGKRARGEWEPAFLFGFSVNVGSFPN
ncbi:hypothetical protein [Myxococcus sp. RHSTA-1-4]|uniref:hypothetical protein n=1 Tax=Myxococcus sp. RHSTA-1-4 TaxID=2874601 RepID=UPI001CBECA01|nr:hypothetical protein [Myxococcus sp. RHSTA-1-4]MBZ4420393.1 hypothetical protein [Myxococcus sp. RHSTA-1-4]